VTDIQTLLESTVVRPVFESVRTNGRRDQSLPPVVVANRRERAYKRVLDALISRGVASIPADLRVRLESMIENWSAQAFDDAFQPIQEFEIQCARDRDRVIAEESGDPRRVIEVLESEYRRRVAQRFGSIELKGVQLNHRVILDLDQVYVPLRLVQSTRPSVIEMLFAISVAEAVKDHTRILLVGSPGSGKSTLVSFLASRCASGEHELSWPAKALPFVITVREVKNVDFSEAWIAERLEVAVEVVRAALAEDRAVLFVDGMDEAPEELQEQLIGAIARFAEDHPRAPVVVTSRPAGAPGEIESRLPGFQAFRLADLTSEEVSEFIDKWCLAAERSARPDLDLARREATMAAADLKARISRSRPVQRIAVNPLLTTILCVVHRYLGRTIPEHRVTLYDRCTDALLYEWDRAKFPKDSAVGDLDANQRRALLRGIASASHERHEAEIPEAEVVRHFAAMLPEMGRPQEDALRIVREIRDRSGLLVELRPGVFSFSHLTFQEYFTALDYASRPDDLLTHAGQPWWQEVIALAAGVPGCDAVLVIRTLLEKNAVITAAKCLETAVKVPLDVRKEVERALEQVLPPRDWENVRELAEIGLTVAPILTRLLPTYSMGGKMMALAFFGVFEYQPAMPLLVELCSDMELTKVYAGDSGYNLTMGDLTVLNLKEMARRSDAAKPALAAALTARPWADVFLEWLNPQAVLGDDFKASTLGKRSSKPAKNTAPAQRSKPRPERSHSAK